MPRHTSSSSCWPLHVAVARASHKLKFRCSKAKTMTSTMNYEKKIQLKKPSRVPLAFRVDDLLIAIYPLGNTPWISTSCFHAKLKQWRSSSIVTGYSKFVLKEGSSNVKLGTQTTWQANILQGQSSRACGPRCSLNIGEVGEVQALQNGLSSPHRGRTHTHTTSGKGDKKGPY